MMDSYSDVRDLLEKRLEWAKKNGAVCEWGNTDLRLERRDFIGRRGWTKREVEKYIEDFHREFDLMEPEGQMDALIAHWYAEWSNEDRDRAEKIRLAELKRAEEKRLAEIKAAQKYKREREKEFSTCGVGWDWRRYTFDAYKPVTKEQREALAVGENFPYTDEECTSTEIKNLWLLGPYGTGKTHLAVSILRRAFIDDGEDVALVSPRQMISEIRASWNDKSLPSPREVIQRYGEVDLLVLDDLRGSYGKKDGTPDQDDLYEVIDLRARNGLRTIITSNLTPKELRVAVGGRNYSRLRDGARVLMLSGPDHRQALVPDLQTKAGEQTSEATS